MSDRRTHLEHIAPPRLLVRAQLLQAASGDLRLHVLPAPLARLPMLLQNAQEVAHRCGVTPAWLGHAFAGGDEWLGRVGRSTRACAHRAFRGGGGALCCCCCCCRGGVFEHLLHAGVSARRAPRAGAVGAAALARVSQIRAALRSAPDAASLAPPLPPTYAAAPPRGQAARPRTWPVMTPFAQYAPPSPPPSPAHAPPLPCGACGAPQSVRAPPRPSSLRLSNPTPIVTPSCMTPSPPLPPPSSATRAAPRGGAAVRCKRVAVSVGATGEQRQDDLCASAPVRVVHVFGSSAGLSGAGEASPCWPEPRAYTQFRRDLGSSRPASPLLSTRAPDRDMRCANFG